MSHAGRRIASAVAATAAVAVPVVAAAGAQAASLPLVGGLPVVGSLTQNLPVGNLPVVGGLAGAGAAGPLSNLPVAGGMLGNLTGNADQSATPQGAPMQLANPDTSSMSKSGPLASGANYVARHGKSVDA